MKLISKNIHYAIKALLYIAKEAGRIISVNELVNKLNMRKAFLRRILQLLSKQRILKSLRGSGGGFILNIEPDKIRLIDILSIFREDIDIFSCLFEKNICSQPGRCLLMKKMKSIESQLDIALRQLTIARLLKSIDRQIKKV